jgi:CRISPR-associated endonuclease/helicase Cas3
MAWGKWSGDGRSLPLRVHLADVAACCCALTSVPVVERRLRGAGGAERQTIARLGALAFLHDMGKLNVWFQAKVLPAAPPGRKAGHVAEALRLLDPPQRPLMEALRLPEVLGWGDAACALLLAALAHHGRPTSRDGGVKTAEIWHALDGYDPLVAAREIGDALVATFPQAFAPGPDMPDSPELQHYFAGLLALADQIGSHEGFFGYDRAIDGDCYARSHAAAREALKTLRLNVSEVRAGLRKPTPPQMFGWPDGAAPKPMQASLRDLPPDVRLIVLESETGSGKTEAAFLRFQRLFEAGEVDALYFAVPTRAAASSLHARINHATQALTGEDAVLALPGYLKIGDATGRALPAYRVEWDDKPEEARRLSRWAAEAPRRYLGALVAVGTVDQAMLAGLRVKWAHFRAAALSRALLVIDEVHASDAYMTAVLGGVLRAHVGRGGHALLMSATLGAAARARWLGGARSKPVAGAPYPAISWAEGGVERALAVAHDERSKTVRVANEPLIADATAVAARALAAAERGARVLVIRNTVAQAVATQTALEALDPDAPCLRVGGVAAPHHGRFAAEDRRLLDAAVEAAFGKYAPQGSVIAIGTQTLEQSLDICADLLIADLCPIDVLLQRIGRLHRHVRPRPSGFDAASCVVLTPESLAPEASLLRFGLGPNRDHGGVYPDLVALEATRRLIAARPDWSIPADNRALVEAGTDPATLEAMAASLGEDWITGLIGLDGKRIAHRQIAQLGMIDRTQPFNGVDELFSDDERILTRLGGDRLILTAPEGTIGPFGAAITTLSVPAHLLKGASADAPPTFEGGGSRLIITMGGARLRYDRFGLSGDADA